MLLLSVMLLKFSVEQRFFIKASKGYLLIQEITGTKAKEIGYNSLCSYSFSTLNHLNTKSPPQNAQ
ncbi:MAG: hypothetical protein D3918_07385 [Candidatus Electrothrix sp. AX2]|nr:hypothetical protein [Candidatus Electrothrix gigas]